MTELEFERQLIEQLSSGIISSTANQMGDNMSQQLKRLKTCGKTFGLFCIN